MFVSNLKNSLTLTALVFTIVCGCHDSNLALRDYREFTFNLKPFATGPHAYEAVSTYSDTNLVVYFRGEIRNLDEIAERWMKVANQSYWNLDPSAIREALFQELNIEKMNFCGYNKEYRFVLNRRKSGELSLDTVVTADENRFSYGMLAFPFAISNFGISLTDLGNHPNVEIERFEDVQHETAGTCKRVSVKLARNGTDIRFVVFLDAMHHFVRRLEFADSFEEYHYKVDGNIFRPIRVDTWSSVGGKKSLIRRTDILEWRTLQKFDKSKAYLPHYGIDISFESDHSNQIPIFIWLICCAAIAMVVFAVFIRKVGRKEKT